MTRRPSNDEEPKTDTALGLKTKVRLELVIVLIGVAVSAGIISVQLQMLRHEMQRTWTIPEQKIYSERLAAQNPQLKVPAVDDVVKDVRGNI